MSIYISFTLSLRFLFQDDTVGHCLFSFKFAVRLGYLGSDQVKSSFMASWRIVKEGQLEHLIRWGANGKMNETSCKLMHHPNPHSSTFHCATCSCSPPPHTHPATKSCWTYKDDFSSSADERVSKTDGLSLWDIVLSCAAVTCQLLFSLYRMCERNWKYKLFVYYCIEYFSHSQCRDIFLTQGKNS